MEKCYRTNLPYCGNALKYLHKIFPFPSPFWIIVGAQSKSLLRLSILSLSTKLDAIHHVLICFCLFIFFVCWSVCLFVCVLVFFLLVCWSVCLSVCLLICLSVCLSVSHVSVNAAQLSLPTKLDNMHHYNMHHALSALRIIICTIAICIMCAMHYNMHHCTMHYMRYALWYAPCIISSTPRTAPAAQIWQPKTHCSYFIMHSTNMHEHKTLHAMQSAVCPALKTHYCTMHTTQMLHFSGRLQEAVWVLFPSNYSSTDCFPSRRNRRPDLSPDIQTIQVTLECLLSIQLNSSSKVHRDYTASLWKQLKKWGPQRKKSEMVIISLINPSDKCSQQSGTLDFFPLRQSDDFSQVSIGNKYLNWK